MRCLLRADSGVRPVGTRRPCVRSNIGDSHAQVSQFVPSAVRQRPSPRTHQPAGCWLHCFGCVQHDCTVHQRRSCGHGRSHRIQRRCRLDVAAAARHADRPPVLPGRPVRFQNRLNLPSGPVSRLRTADVVAPNSHRIGRPDADPCATSPAAQGCAKDSVVKLSMAQ